MQNVINTGRTSVWRVRCSAFQRIQVLSSRNIRFQHTISEGRNLPRLVRRSTWHSIIPRGLLEFLKQRTKQPFSKQHNPASYFIWIYLLIGSQAIRILGIQNEFQTFTRRADVKIDKLREVIQKLQKGEEVDVEKALGTGDEIQELEWEEALRDLENEDRIWQNNKKKKREEKDIQAKEDQDANPINMAAATGLESQPSPPGKSSMPPTPGFY